MCICRRPICRPSIAARPFIVRALFAVPAMLLLAACEAPQPDVGGFPVVEASIPELQAAMESGELTSRQLVTEYLIRIALYEERLNAAVSINSNALAEADELDAERARGEVRGPLHGIPVALKDNIHTTHLPTTGGALAFEGFVPPYEATLTTNLREAGAIIIAKAGLTEFANWMAGPPRQMPGNYNALTGFGYNPYDPRRDPRPATFDGRPALSTGGSSSGVGTAASFWAGNVGTDTGGSVISPSNANMLVGIRPTLGRVSRWGIAPVTLDHDMAGPMTRTVADAAIMLGAMESAAPDPNDPATGICEPPPDRDYTQFLNADGLRGARIGIPRAFYYDPIRLEGEDDARGGLSEAQATLMEDAITVLEAQGAVVVDPADVPSYAHSDPDSNFAAWGFCLGAHQAKGSDESCSVNFKYGAKRDFNAWLESLGPDAPVKTLGELRQWNLDHADAGAMRYGQSRFDISDEMDVEADRPPTWHATSCSAAPGASTRCWRSTSWTPSSRREAGAPGSPRARAPRSWWCPSASCPISRHSPSRRDSTPAPPPSAWGSPGPTAANPA